MQRSASTFYTRAKRLVEKQGHGQDVDESYVGLSKLLNIINGAMNAAVSAYHEPFDKCVHWATGTDRRGRVHCGMLAEFSTSTTSR